MIFLAYLKRLWLWLRAFFVRELPAPSVPPEPVFFELTSVIPEPPKEKTGKTIIRLGTDSAFRSGESKWF